MRLIFYRYLYIFVYMRLLKISVDTEEGGEVNQLGKGGGRQIIESVSPVLINNPACIVRNGDCF